MTHAIAAAALAIALLGSAAANAAPNSHFASPRFENMRGDQMREHWDNARGRDFRGRDIRNVSPDERAVWQSGGWRHDWHDGRLGWWWIVGDFWYFYPEPIYPYPDYAPVIAEQQPPPPQSWYYCENPRGYYPYVQWCNDPWHPVPSAPPQ